MGYQRMTQAEWADLIAAQGYERAADIVRNFGTVLEETGLPPTVADPSLAALPMVTQPVPSATTPQAPAMQGQAGMDEGTQAGGLAALERALVKQPQKREDVFRKRFEEGQQRIQQMYAGPDTSQMLAALSQALLSPRPYGGFAGTAYNVSRAMNEIGQQRKTAQQQRAEALTRLQDAYQTRQMEGEDEALKLRYQIAKAQVDERAAQAKASAPSYQLDQQGNVREVPKQVFRPSSRAEYDALPPGAWYVVPDGPQAGQVVRKTAVSQ